MMHLGDQLSEGQASPISTCLPGGVLGSSRDAATCERLPEEAQLPAQAGSSKAQWIFPGAYGNSLLTDSFLETITRVDVVFPHHPLTQ